jgi:hypothetical protein
LTDHVSFPLIASTGEEEGLQRFSSKATFHQSYTGEKRYSDFSVGENLYLYFQEQVFGPERPSRNAPYIAEVNRSPSKSVLSVLRLIINDTNANIRTEELSFVAAPSRPESLLSLYSTKLALPFALEDESSKGFEEPSRLTILQTPEAKPKSYSSSRPLSDKDSPSMMNDCLETDVTVVLTDLNVYFICGFFSESKIYRENERAFRYEEAPVPILLSCHAVRSMR